MTDAHGRREPRPCRVVLLGMMGSGKTTLGTRLAERTGWPYLDNDALLRDATGRTARQLAGDVDDLRSAEARAAHAGLDQPPPVIVACAAGVVTDAELRRRLAREGLVVWLHAPAGVLADRASYGRHRPWLEGDAAAWLAATAAERAPLYREVATFEVDTASAPPTELVERIVAWLATTHCAGALGTPLADPGSHD